MRAGAVVAGMIALAGLVCGCVSKRVVVRVYDAETQQPIRGALVTANYSGIYVGDLFPPRQTQSLTDADGIATLRVRKWRQAAQISASAEGYLPYVPRLALLTLPEMRRELRRQQQKLPPDVVELELYRQPWPTVTIVLPAGYRGAVPIHWTRRPGFSHPPGARQFVYHFVPGEPVRMTLAPPLHLVRYTDYDACYDDGTPLRSASSFRGRQNRTPPRDQPVAPEESAWRLAAITHDLHDLTGVVYVAGTAQQAKTIGDQVRASLPRPQTRPTQP
ncbi:MAG TPA: hypothetical protein VNL70_03325 [Tepidisphaeraceae bacterium]|nr:hypothetical protein [Tepidisphaeraceae bacterium]